MSSISSETNPVRAMQQEIFRLKSENTQLRDYVNRLQQTIRALNELQLSLDQITADTDVLALINRILTRALDAVDSRNGSLLLLDEDSGELVFVDVIGVSRENLLSYRLPPGTGVVGYTVKTHRPQLVPNVLRNPAFTPQVDKVTGFKTHSLICVPLLDGDRVLGAIEVVNSEQEREFNELDQDVLLLVARLASLAIVKAEKEGVE